MFLPSPNSHAEDNHLVLYGNNEGNWAGALYLPTTILNPLTLPSLKTGEVSPRTTLVLSSGVYVPLPAQDFSLTSTINSSLSQVVAISYEHAQGSALVKKSFLDPISLYSHHPTSLCFFPESCTFICCLCAYITQFFLPSILMGRLCPSFL